MIDGDILEDSGQNITAALKSREGKKDIRGNDRKSWLNLNSWRNTGINRYANDL